MQRSKGSFRKTAGAWIALVALAVAAPAPTAHADDYEEDRAGHPFRILAYVLHPVGVVLDYVIFRPAHWIGSHEPFETLFGHEDHDPAELEED